MDLIAINKNPYEGLKHQPDEASELQNTIAINKNPYEGLKPCNAESAHQNQVMIAINKNPYEGLKLSLLPVRYI